jgi:hypothetical protein
MGKGSQQSKRKQQTSKNESQATPQKPDSQNTERKLLTMEQASIFKQLIQATNEAQAQLNFALSAAGLAENVIIGGDLDGENPHFVITKQ